MGIATKKGYCVLDLSKGAIHELIGLNGTPYPNILSFKDSWVVITGLSIRLFDRTCKSINGAIIPLQTTQKQLSIVSMLIKGNSLLVLRETVINVYDLLDCVRLQDILIEKEEIPRDIFENAGRVLVLLDLPPSRGEYLSKLIYLQTISVQERVQMHLAKLELAEAHKVFVQSIPPNDIKYAEKKEQFNVEAGWALFLAFSFEEAKEWLMNANYDPFEFIALIPGRIQKEDAKLKSIKDIAEERFGVGEMNNSKIIKGTEAVIELLELKRKFLIERYEIGKDDNKILKFVHPFNIVNATFKDHSTTLIETIEMIDPMLIKLYIKHNQLQPIKDFFDSIKTFHCDYNSFENYLKKHLENDVNQTAHLAMICFYEKKEKYNEALDLCTKLLGSNNIKTTEMTCKIITKILSTKIIDISTLFKYTEILLKKYPREVKQIFTVSESVMKATKNNEIMDYIDELLGDKDNFIENYLEAIVTKDSTDDKYHTRLALFYINKMEKFMKIEEKMNVDELINEEAKNYRKKIIQFLDTSNKYDTTEILPAINKIGMSREELILYSKKKMHNEALNILIRRGKEIVNFKDAEDYCLMQEESLLGILFERIIAVYKALVCSVKENPNESINERISLYESYCKEYLKKFATNEKMDFDTVIKALPDDWLFQEKLTEALLDATKEKVGRANNSDIEINLAAMEELNLQAELAELQKSYAIVIPEDKCAVCHKAFRDTKAIYVYPNGVTIHQSCAKDLNVCPEGNYNFAKNANYY